MPFQKPARGDVTLHFVLEKANKKVHKNSVERGGCPFLVAASLRQRDDVKESDRNLFEEVDLSYERRAPKLHFITNFHKTIKILCIKLLDVHLGTF